MLELACLEYLGGSVLMELLGNVFQLGLPTTSPGHLGIIGGMGVAGGFLIPHKALQYSYYLCSIEINWEAIFHRPLVILFFSVGDD